MDYILYHESMLRVCFFVGIFIIIATLEILLVRRSLTTPKRKRWFANIGIVIINTILLRIIFPVGVVGMAIWVENQGWGLFNKVHLPFWVEVVLSIIFLDFIVYLQHVMFHALPLFWRLHMIHHADMDYDLTTGIRFHPIEMLVSMFIKIAAVILIGASPLAVIIFEILLNGTAMFNHGNFFINTTVDRILRLLVVTPDMHRVHHSVLPSETNSNFGFNFPWWDRLMGTYISQPSGGHIDMTIGLNQFRDPSQLTLCWMLVLPFMGKKGPYAIGHRGSKSKK